MIPPSRRRLWGKLWARDPVGASDAAPLVRHLVSRCIHVVEDESGTSTKCGRMISARYVRLIERPRFMHPVCSTCFK